MTGAQRVLVNGNKIAAQKIADPANETVLNVRFFR